MKDTIKNFIYNKLLLLTKSYNYSLPQNFIYALIMASLVSVIVVISIPDLILMYFNYNYLVYLLTSFTCIILLTPLIYLITFPITMMVNVLYVYYLRYRDITIQEDRKKKLISESIDNLEVKIISAEKLSNIVLLPTETLIKYLNACVIDGKAEIHVNDTGNIYYNFNLSIDVVVGKLLKRVIDAN